jgi:predicted small secreted protein
MSLLELSMLSISLIGFYTFYKIKKSLKSEKNSFMGKEASRIVFQDAKVDDSYSSEGRVYTRGLSLIKDKESKKYTLIPQAQVCDIGLY